jgi:hypothetical protein
MAGANYEYCRFCDSKALYVGEEDVPDNVEVVHIACLEKDRADREKAIVEGILMAALSDLDDDTNPFAAALAARTRRVRENITAEIRAFAKESAKTDSADAVLGLLTGSIIASGRPRGSFDELADDLEELLIEVTS